MAQQTNDPKKVEVQKQVLTGEGIAGLFPAPPSLKVDIEFEGKILQFEVDQLDNETFAKIGDKIKISNVNLDEVKGSLAGMKMISDLYWPALKVVLPKCCINPKFIDGVSTDPKVISVNRLKLEVGIELFDKILAASGLGKQAEQDRKN